jgi:WD repeat-containing protein 61
VKLHKQLEIREHNMAVYDVSIDAEGKFYSGSADCYVAKWDATTGKQDSFTVRCDFPVYSLSMITPQLLCIGLSTGNLHLIDTSSRKEIRFFTQHKAAVFTQLSLTKKGLHLTADADGNLAVWRITDWSLLLFLPLNCDKIRAIAANHDESKVAIGSKDGSVRLFETEFFNELNSFYAHRDGVNALCFSPTNPNQLFSGGKDGYLRIWNVQNSEKINALPAHNFAVYGIVFSADGSHFISCSRDKSIKLWETDKLQVVQKIDAQQGGHTHSVNRIYWHGNTILSCSDDRRIIVWKLTD